jgi:hypothetical protein
MGAEWNLAVIARPAQVISSAMMPVSTADICFLSLPGIFAAMRGGLPAI